MTKSRGFYNCLLAAFVAALLLWPLAARAEDATAGLSSSAAAPDYTKRAAEVSQHIQKTFWDANTGLYRKTVADKHPDFVWPGGVMFSALVAASRHDPSCQPVLEKFFAGLNGYWDSKARIPGYEPAPTRGGGSDKYYDDNAWLALTFLEAYEQTHDTKYLTRAEETLKFVLSGWDDELGGGIWWHERHKDGTKNACSNAPAATACLRLARVKDRADYVGWATKIVEWTRKNLQAKDGLFDDRKVVATGEIKRGKLTYNTALMIRFLLGLWRHTGKTEYLDEAKRIGKASDWFLGKGTGAYRDDVKWSHLLVEADLELYRATKDEYVLERARKNGEHFYSVWKAKQPQDLMTNAAIARLFWLLADHETPAGQAFWDQSDRVRR